MKEWTVKQGRDQSYPWELLDPDGDPAAKFVFESDAWKAANTFNNQEKGRQHEQIR